MTLTKIATIACIGAMVFITLSCTHKTDTAQPDEGFSFVFMTDIHLQHERGAYEAFQKVIDTVNQLDSDFIMTGGDLVFDVLRGNPQRGDSLFTLYKTATAKFNIPVHHTIGNHELFGIYPESDVDSTHADYKYGMFKRHLGDTYYSFDHKGWHFIVVNSIIEKDKAYYGMIDPIQKAWIEQDLAKTNPSTPIAMVTHIPFVTAFYSLYPAKDNNQPNGRGIYNNQEILALFANHNLKLVLQGHLHWLEDVTVGKTRFITGGAVAGRPSWRGTRHNEEGFLNIHIDNADNISWDYIDYGWTARVSETN